MSVVSNHCYQSYLQHLSVYLIDSISVSYLSSSHSHGSERRENKKEHRGTIERKERREEEKEEEISQKVEDNEK